MKDITDLLVVSIVLELIKAHVSPILHSRYLESMMHDILYSIPETCELSGHIVGLSIGLSSNADS